MNNRFWSPSNPLNRHHMLFAFLAFFDSSLSVSAADFRDMNECANFHTGSDDHTGIRMRVKTCTKSWLLDLAPASVDVVHLQRENREAARKGKQLKEQRKAMSRDMICSLDRAMMLYERSPLDASLQNTLGPTIGSWRKQGLQTTSASVITSLEEDWMPRDSEHFQYIWDDAVTAKTMHG